MLKQISPNAEVIFPKAFCLSLYAENLFMLKAKKKHNKVVSPCVLSVLVECCLKLDSVFPDLKKCVKFAV